MNKYTPTTDEVRDAFAGKGKGYANSSHYERQGSEFDRWLAEHDRLNALLPPVQRVTRAWTEVGIAPGYHKAAQAQLIKTWPVLARAVENLVAAQAHLGRVD